MNTSKRFSPATRANAVRMVHESQAIYPSRWAVINMVAGKVGCTAGTLWRWVRQLEEGGSHTGARPRGETGHVKALKREVRKLRQANEILSKMSAYFLQAESRQRFHQSFPQNFIF